jgi:predicted N-acetyltransferase YhbS
METIIRESREADGRAISDLATAAFGATEGPVIATLIGNLAADVTARPVLSLVAVIDERVAGHILFPNAVIERPGTGKAGRPGSAAILTPLALHPRFQNRGIGGRLIAEGTARMKEAGVELVFVLAYPAYYTRHGFTPAGALGYQAPYPIPPQHADAWMVRLLRPANNATAEARLRCALALDERQYWVE